VGRGWSYHKIIIVKEQATSSEQNKELKSRPIVTYKNLTYSRGGTQNSKNKNK
jgi:hypothetical protein